MKIVKWVMTAILMNQSLCQDLGFLLVNQHLVQKICLVKQHSIILKVFLLKTIQINFKDLKIIYLVKILKLKITYLVKLLKVSYNRQAQDNSKQIFFKIRVQQNKSFQKWILKVYLTNKQIRTNQF